MTPCPIFKIIKSHVYEKYNMYYIYIYIQYVISKYLSLKLL